MGDAHDRPAFYALSPGGWRDYWTLLHPPYTLWHLSYVVIGASLAPEVDLSWLAETVAIFLRSARPWHFTDIFVIASAAMPVSPSAATAGRGPRTPG